MTHEVLPHATDGDDLEALKQMKNRLSQMFDDEKDPVVATRLSSRISELIATIAESESQQPSENDSPARKMRERRKKNPS